MPEFNTLSGECGLRRLPCANERRFTILLARQGFDAEGQAAIVTATGQVTGFGDAHRYAGRLPLTTVVGIVPSADGHGYLLLDTAGNVYPHGDAIFYGGASGRPGPFRAIGTRNQAQQATAKP